MTQLYKAIKNASKTKINNNNSLNTLLVGPTNIFYSFVQLRHDQLNFTSIFKFFYNSFNI